jgi:hypothetical protein
MGFFLNYIERVGEFNEKWTIFQLHHGKKRFCFDEMMMIYVLN